MSQGSLHNLPDHNVTFPVFQRLCLGKHHATRAMLQDLPGERWLQILIQANCRCDIPTIFAILAYPLQPKLFAATVLINY